MTTMKKIVVLKRLNVLYVKISKQLKATQPARNSKKMKRIAELIKRKGRQKSARIHVKKMQDIFDPLIQLPTMYIIQFIK